MSPRLLVGRDDHYTIRATTLATWPPYEVGRILRGPFHGTFFFSRHACVSWLLNPCMGLGQYNKIYVAGSILARGNMFFFSHEVCVESQTAQLFTVRYLFVLFCSMTFLASKIYPVIILIIIVIYYIHQH